MVNETEDASTTASTPRGARSIARQLQDAITSGTYGRGEQLPTERQLAVSYGASRTTIRKALTWLEDQKLVERRAGSGTYANYERGTSGEDIAGRTSPLELIEVRAAIEPQMARLAVLHASARDLERLQTLDEELQAAERTDDAVRYSVVDEQFHLAIASATSNPLMIWLYEQIDPSERMLSGLRCARRSSRRKTCVSITCSIPLSCAPFKDVTPQQPPRPWFCTWRRRATISSARTAGSLLSKYQRNSKSRRTSRAPAA